MKEYVTTSIGIREVLVVVYSGYQLVTVEVIVFSVFTKIE
jgi:hypothetical protein